MCFDPARFPYAEEHMYRPSGQEIGTAKQFLRVMDAHGMHHAVVADERLSRRQPLHARCDRAGTGALQGHRGGGQRCQP